MQTADKTHLLLRAGAAFAFLYPALAAIVDPVSWFSYVPDALRALPIDSLILLHGIGAIEIVLALWVLSGWRIRIPAALMTAFLVVTVFIHPNEFSVLFRDLSIAALTLALALSPTPRHEEAP